MYGSRERTTLDGEWTYEELEGELKDTVYTFMSEKNIAKKYEHRAVHDRDLVKYDEYMSNKIMDDIFEQDKDLIQVYNEQYDKRKAEKLFGIIYFEEYVQSLITKLLKRNEVK